MQNCFFVFTHRELQNLKTFLQDTADKERKARAELQAFIEELIGRAERAEAELQALKTRSFTPAARDVHTEADRTLSSGGFDVTERQRYETISLASVKNNL